MKRSFFGIATATMLLAGGSFFAFAGNGQSVDCPLKGTPNCPLVKDEAKKEKEAEATVAAVATNTTTATVPPCCKKK